MSRFARKNIISKYVHLMVQGINKEFIFKDDFEIKTYLKYLHDNIQDTDLKIISYCMMSNHAHFLIYINDTNELSKMMSKVNTKYAMFYNNKNNRCGVLFRNRYKTQEILTYSHLLTCIKYIHNNPVKAGMCEKASDYRYSSYNEYKNNRGILTNWKFVQGMFKKYNISIDDILDEYEPTEKIRFIEYDDINDKDSFKNNIIKEFMKQNYIINIDELKENKRLLRQIASIMYCDYNFTQKEIADLLKVSRLKIHRIINEKLNDD